MLTGRKQIERTDAEDARGGGWIVFTIVLAVTAGVLWVANGGLLAPPPPPPPDLGW
ncbi:MAG: hypothetical protein MEQ07_00740 [Aquimonas sp.]|nr:hypothetical protein [Aquimonas sp.]